MEITKREVGPVGAGFAALIQFKHQKKARRIYATTEPEVNQRLNEYIAYETKIQEAAASRRLENRIKQAGRNAMVAQGVKPGDIFYSSWGYDQTNIDFYQVTKVFGKMAELTPIRGSEVEGSRYEPGSYASVTPVPGAFSGAPEKHLIKASYNGEAYFHLNSFSSASRYDGKPKQYSWGH